MNLAQASAHMVHTGPYSGQTVAAIATSDAGRAWLDRIRLLIPAETTGAMGELRSALNVFFGQGSAHA